MDPRRDPNGLDLETKFARGVQARHGWSGTLAAFLQTSSNDILQSLQSFVPDAGLQQQGAWQEELHLLRSAITAPLAERPELAECGIVLEYEMPLESRRADAIILLADCVVVFEFKGKAAANEADVDQTHAYGRDLRCYHEFCHHRTVIPVLVPTRSGNFQSETRGVLVRGPSCLLELLNKLWRGPDRSNTLARFLAADAYRPLPTLVRAARELFETGSLRRVHRAAAVTDGAVEAVTSIVRQAEATQTRRLILLTGVPGAGKTLVGLRAVHAHMLDDLAEPRDGRKPLAPAVFLSGNGPLVEVLQYELKDAGGGGKAFVRGVKDYVKQYDRPGAKASQEHVLVFDEAQRAYDAAMVADKHGLDPALGRVRSEPELFVDFALRVPTWCVVLGLIGGGQEINRGEEAGLAQWAQAIRHSGAPGDWTIHGPAHVAEAFRDLPFREDSELHLDRSLRSHLAFELHRFVGDLLSREPVPASVLSRIAADLGRQGHALLVTRDLDAAKNTCGTATPITRRLVSGYSRLAETGLSGALGSTIAAKSHRAFMARGTETRKARRAGVRVGNWRAVKPSLGPKASSLMRLCSPGALIL